VALPNFEAEATLGEGGFVGAGSEEGFGGGDEQALVFWCGEECAEHGEAFADAVGAALGVNIGRGILGEVEHLKRRIVGCPSDVAIYFGGEFLCAARDGDEGKRRICGRALCEGVK
jgi:hypothetical protein